MTWWAAQVASNKEYDTKRELISISSITEKDILIPRRQTYSMHDEDLKKKTETMMPGYILLNLGYKPVLKGIEYLSNYIKILGKVTDEEIENITEHENIPEDLDVANGDKIIVTKGPFSGVKGTILEERNESKYFCRLVFHGNELDIDLDSNIIEKIS